MTREAAREVAPGLQARQHVLERFAHHGVVRGGRETAQAAQQRHAGLRDGVHLPREQHQIGNVRLAETETPQQRLRV